MALTVSGLSGVPANSVQEARIKFQKAFLQNVDDALSNHKHASYLGAAPGVAGLTKDQVDAHNNT